MGRPVRMPAPRPWVLGCALTGLGAALALAGPPVVTVEVVDRQGRPIAGVPVILEQDHPDGIAAVVRETDAVGRHRFTGLRRGLASVQLDRTGARPMAIHVPAFGDRPVRLALMEVGVLGGRVVDADGRPLARLGVALRLPRAADATLAETDGEGRFTFTHLAPGPYQLEVSDPRIRFGHVSYPGLVTDPPERPLLIRLPP